MSQSGVIIRRAAGHFIPNQYLELAIKENPTAWGAAVVTGADLQVSKGDGLDIEMIQDVMKTFEKQDITFYLCNSPDAINEDDLGPFVIIPDKLVAFIEGNFPGFAKTGSSHPPEFFVANELLVPKFSGLLDMADGDVGKLMTFMKKPFMKNDLLKNAVGRGVMTFVASTGEAISFSESDKSSEYPWGWVSNNYGYAAGVPKKEEPAKPEKKSMFGGKSTVREPAKSVTPVIAAAVQPAKTETSAVKPVYQKKTVSPPKMSRSQTKDWYKQRLGYLPEGWGDQVAIEQWADQTGKILSRSDAQKLGLQALDLPRLNNPKQIKDVEASPEIQANNLPTVTGEVLPIMSPKTREYMKDLLSDPKNKKLIQENGDIITNPATVQALEVKLPDFGTQLGLKSIDDFLVLFDYPMMLALGRDKPDALANMCFTFRNIICGAKAKVASKQESGTVSPSQVDPPQEVKPVVQKRSMFGGKKAA